MKDLTKIALGASLRKLMAEKPLNKITISDITNECGCNRMTFYYHFHDIYELLEWALEQETEEALDGKLTLEETALKQNRPLTDAEELVKSF
jgi:AcrR family transcriptional regulator